MEVPPRVAEIVAAVFEVTPDVLILKAAEVLPAGIEIVAGTLTPDWLLVSDTVSPPAGATELNTTEPVLDWPPFTVLGLRVSEVNVGPIIERTACKDWPFALAEIVAVVPAAVLFVVTVNVALL